MKANRLLAFAALHLGLPIWLDAIAVPDPSLIAHWTFDEGSGDVAKDVTGRGHDATLKNVEWVPSPRGHALRFDSKEDLARYGKVDSMNLSGDMTLAVWVRTDSAVEPDTTRLIFGDGGLGVERNLNLRLDGTGGLRFEWADGNSAASLIGPASLMNGTWKHVTVVANARDTVVAMYVDGEEVARMSGPRPISKAPVKERLTGWFYNGFFRGDLDDIRLYARALDAGEVRNLFASQADLQVAPAAVLFDGSGPEPRGLAAVKFHNWSKGPRRVELNGAGLAKSDIALKPGEATEAILGEVALRPVWSNRNDLFVCEPPREAARISVAVSGGEMVEQMSLGPPPQRVLEPMRVDVKDPWRREMTPGKTESLELELAFAMPAAQLRDGTVRIRLASRETGKEALSRDMKGPQARQPLILDARALPWGAYEMTASFHDPAGRALATCHRVVAILPDGRHQIRVLNNLVSELMAAGPRGLLGERRIEFMNPREGWVWFRASGTCVLRLEDEILLSAQDGKPASEAMRLLPAGRHALEVDGTPTGIDIRAIPALVYNVHPSMPMIRPFGAHTWERLRKHTLPNCNMIESPSANTPEYREWVGQGKKWLTNVQAPGLLDTKEWTEDNMLEIWLKPGTSTAHAERPGLNLAKLSGVQVDEYYPGSKSTRGGLTLTTALSIARLAGDPAFSGKLWIPFLAGKYGATDALLMKTVLGAGWPWSEEVYAGEMPTEAENADSIRSHFRSVATAYEGAQPGSLRRMIFTLMYSCMPYCTANRCPQADFRVHLDMQVQMLAADPVFFGLWGVQPYRSNYADEETLSCMGRLLRHYCIEGRADRMLGDPYELTHVTDPDFKNGARHWQVTAAEVGAVCAGTFAGYGQLQGRYPACSFGDTFLCLKRSAKGPNVVSQQLQGLKPGRLYSLKLITADRADLQGGRTRPDPQALTIDVSNAEVLPGGFHHPFPSARGPKPFTREKPFWMTYHWLRFRARGPTAKLSVSDWAGSGAPGGPAGQEVIVSFIEVQPAIEQ